MKMKGEIKSDTLNQVFFGPDGKPQTTQLSAPPPAQDPGDRGRRGRVKEKVVKNKKEEMQEFVQALMKLSNSYLILPKRKCRRWPRPARSLRTRLECRSAPRTSCSRETRWS